MRMPGFVAHTSLYPSVGRYQTNGRYFSIGTAAMTPAANWGRIAPGDCDYDNPGIRLYSAIVWNCPWGQSWDVCCHRTPGPAGTAFAGRYPDYCDPSPFNEWGTWQVPDDTCLYPPYQWCDDPNVTAPCTNNWDCSPGNYCDINTHRCKYACQP